MNHPSPNAAKSAGCDSAKTTSCDSGQNLKAGVLGAHPIGAGVGAVGVGAAAGAAGGAVAGPIGAVAGAAIGAVVGGLAGSATAELLDPNIETTYWRENFSTRPYGSSTPGYDEFAPAYQYGWESYGNHGGAGKTFESVEADLGRGWDKAKGASKLGWDKAKVATHDAWDRVMHSGKGHCATATAASNSKH
jgi:hypothetical protein